MLRLPVYKPSGYNVFYFLRLENALRQIFLPHKPRTNNSSLLYVKSVTYRRSVYDGGGITRSQSLRAPAACRPHNSCCLCQKRERRPDSWLITGRGEWGGAELCSQKSFKNQQFPCVGLHFLRVEGVGGECVTNVLH